MSDFQRASTALSSLRVQLNNLSTKKVILISERLTQLSKNLALINKLELKDTNEKLQRLRVQIGNMEEKEFSFFNILGVQENELVHSNFLAWLLTTTGNHGFGTCFIEKMLALLASKNGSVSLEGIDPDKLVIKREESGEKGRIDLRIFDPSGLFQCIIENKINSTEGDSQTQRYYEEWSGYYERELFVFLTLDPKQKPLDRKNYICLNYKEILKLLNDLQPDSPDTKFLMKNYIHTLEGLIMAEKFQDFSDRSKLYFQFFKEIQDVSKAWDEDRKLILTTLKQELTDYLSQKNTDWKVESTGSHVLIYKEDWHPKNGQGISFWLEPVRSEAAIDLYVYGEPIEFNSKYIQHFLKELSDNSIKKTLDEFKKSLTGGSLSLRKTVPLAKEDSITKAINEIKEMITNFEGIIDKSIAEYRKAAKIT